ncbi:MAG: DUF72 domain-containing protein [Terriglobia bacterium]
MNRKPSEIRVGPAGWSYEDWDGIVYPRPRPRNFHEAAFLAQFFDTIEINTSFYHPPSAKMTAAWVRRVAHNPRFKFTAKLWQRFTHEREANREDEKTFKEGMKPLVDAGRLGALLLQFPWSFKCTRANREYLGGLAVEFVEYPLVLEVRHSSWNKPEIFKMLADLRVGFCNIDQPVIGRSIAPSERAIPQSGIGYVRLHGRNYEHWFTSHDKPEERYNYYYSLQELEPWAERIRNIALSAEVTYVVTNNHFQGKAVANALQLVHLLRGNPVAVPETLIAHYPELAKIAMPAAPAPVISLDPEQPALLFQTPGGGEKKS